MEYFKGNGNQNDPGQDLALISSCNHIILSYGTFGIAAAWFNNHGNLSSGSEYPKLIRVIFLTQQVKSFQRIISLEDPSAW
jgi:Glycosyl transferase family 11